MMFVRLTEEPTGSIKAETDRAVIGYFDDMTIEQVTRYLVDRAEAVGEEVRFVDSFQERQETVDFSRLMKRKF